MLEILSEINVGNKITEPIVNIFKKKKESKIFISYKKGEEEFPLPLIK